MDFSDMCVSFLLPVDYQPCSRERQGDSLVLVRVEGTVSFSLETKAGSVPFLNGGHNLQHLWKKPKSLKFLIMRFYHELGVAKSYNTNIESQVSSSIIYGGGYSEKFEVLCNLFTKLIN
ncbi:hypothetical protein OSB04_013354 [Centaurea solstitialis]|uniref:Uncharacterized protein n=1 Tax=Centaurea solstitialis TaxID=347529 RepID=A0AA38WNA5_9ASTR|nr:hypothetical protein OSB04_013354 [Centaurea solstitialis]